MIEFITIKNKFNTEVTLSTLGASIYDIKTLDKDNKLESIIYTTKDKKDFVTERSCLGKTIGRTGGRISNSTFTLNGIKYNIPSYDKNGLHGGKDGVGYKEFEYKKSEASEYFEVEFKYLSKDMESGYPGNLDLRVTYRLYKEINNLSLIYKGISDKDTLLNLSNHSYFNLSGNAKRDIMDHELYINASQMEEIKGLLPRRIVDCKDIYSFKKGHKIGKFIFNPEIKNNTNGYDFPYIFDDANKDIFNVVLKDSISGRSLSIKTTYPTVVIYTCNFTGREIMNNDKVMTPYYAVCLECMYHPNTINSDFLEEKKDILPKGVEYNNMIEYYFGA